MSIKQQGCALQSNLSAWAQTSVFVILLSTGLYACNGTTSQVSTSSTSNTPDTPVTQPVFTKSFSQAKREATQIYLSHQEAFYSGCEYYAVGKKLVPLKSSCGYKTRKNEVRASRIEWEHIVSMWQIGHQLQCWQNGGRSNCRKVSARFRQIEADLHNLVPAIGELNADRSNFKHGMIEGEKRVYGAVDAEVDFRAGIFEPRPKVRGDIARIYFCIQQKYGLDISNQQMQLFKSWDQSDPVSPWEKQRNLKIQAIQGDSCQFVSGEPDYPTTLRCDPAKKYCSHMATCDEARFYLNSCGRTRLDRDHDGIPCEALCN